jgi:hypothetical protein
MGDRRQLRVLAEWYRVFAEVGDSRRRLDRLKFAEWLEQKAGELRARVSASPLERSAINNAGARRRALGATRSIEELRTEARHLLRITKNITNSGLVKVLAARGAQLSARTREIGNSSDGVESLRSNIHRYKSALKKKIGGR